MVSGATKDAIVVVTLAMEELTAAELIV